MSLTQEIAALFEDESIIQFGDSDLLDGADDSDHSMNQYGESSFYLVVVCDLFTDSGLVGVRVQTTTVG